MRYHFCALARCRVTPVLRRVTGSVSRQRETGHSRPSGGCGSPAGIAHVPKSRLMLRRAPARPSPLSELHFVPSLYLQDQSRMSKNARHYGGGRRRRPSPGIARRRRHLWTARCTCRCNCGM